MRRGRGSGGEEGSGREEGSGGEEGEWVENTSPQVLLLPKLIRCGNYLPAPSTPQALDNPGGTR